MEASYQITIKPMYLFQLYSSSDGLEDLFGLIFSLIILIPVWLCFKSYRDQLKEAVDGTPSQNLDVENYEK